MPLEVLLSNMNLSRLKENPAPLRFVFEEAQHPMPVKTGPMRAFLTELRRRKVLQVAIAYAAIAWLLMQVVSLALGAFEAPGWIMQAVLVLLAIGFPLVIVLSWIFDLTPQGILRTLPRELVAEQHDALSAVMVLSLAKELPEKSNAPHRMKTYCDRFGAHSTELRDQQLIARFDNAHEALHCAIYLLSLAPPNMPYRASLAIGEAGIHAKQLHGDAVDAALWLEQLESSAGLVVSSAFHDAILDHPGNPLHGRLQRQTEDYNNHAVSVYQASHELITQPAVQSWQQLAEPQSSQAGTWVKLTALVFLAAIAVAMWRWLPEIELPGSADQVPSIAVLPFQDLSQDQGNQWFVAGLGEEVLTMIAKISGFRVVSKRTALGFDKQDTNLTELGRLLGVNHILEGSVQRSGDQIRINMRLSATADGSLRWAQNYDARPDDLIGVQQDIGRSVADSLEVALSDEEQISLQKAPDIDPRSYTIYLEAIGFLSQPPSSESLNRAQSRLNQVLAINSEFSDALAALCRTNLSWYKLTRDSAYFSQAEQQCGSALQASQDNVSLMLALGQLYNSKGDADTAIEFFQRGLGLDSDDVDLQSGLAEAYRIEQDFTGAEQLIKQAIKIEPGSWGLYSQLGSLYLSMARYGEAASQYEEAAKLVPENASVQGNIGSAYYYQGEFGKAAEAFERSLGFNPTSSAYSNIATLWFYEGAFEKARNYYERAAELTPRDYRVWSNLADAESQIAGFEESSKLHYSTAMDLAGELHEINPSQADVMSVLAWCAVNLGQSAQAERWITGAVEIAPNDAETAYLSALVYAALKQPVTSRLEARRAIEAGYPENAVQATPILRDTLGIIVN